MLANWQLEILKIIFADGKRHLNLSDFLCAIMFSNE